MKKRERWKEEPKERKKERKNHVDIKIKEGKLLKERKEERVKRKI